MTTGIYKILNKTTGKFYIGSAVNIETRWMIVRYRALEFAIKCGCLDHEEVLKAAKAFENYMAGKEENATY